MAVFKRFKGKRIKHGSPNYNIARWVCEGRYLGEYYKESFPHAKTKKDAELYEDEIKEKIRLGEYYLDKDKTTFADYVQNIYLPRIKTTNPSWENNKKYQIERLIGFFGPDQIKKINRTHCEAFRDFRKTQKVPCQKCEKFKPTCYMCSGDSPRYKPPCWKCKKRIEEIEIHKQSCQPETVSNATVNRDLVTLSDIFTDAVIDKVIKENPMKFVKHLKEAESRDRILSPDEKDRLFAVFSDEDISAPFRRLRALILIACTTSWREGRIMKLKKEDLNFTDCTVRVSSSKQDKSKTVPVSRVTWSVLLELAETIESGALFRNSRTGEPLNGFPYDSWNKLLKKANIENLTFHDLRHQAATDLYQLGTKLFGIQTALGHKQITTTQRYVSVIDEHLRNDLDNLGEVYESYLVQ